MLGNFCRRSTNLKQRVNEKQNVESDSAASSGGQGKYLNVMSASLGPGLRQHCQFLMLACFVTNIFFEESLGGGGRLP